MMSAGDALAAIHLISTSVGKVKDNKDELLSLSKRLQFIVQSLEESRNRDAIRDVEYEDSLSSVFELITRAERVSRRMLKRSLGDRTWNAREISNDLKRLNEDAQTFLSVHTIKTLDFVQTAQTQQQDYLASSVKEIIAKIAELDLALSGSKPPPVVITPSPLGLHERSEALAPALAHPPASRGVGPSSRVQQDGVPPPSPDRKGHQSKALTATSLFLQRRITHPPQGTQSHQPPAVGHQQNSPPIEDGVHEPKGVDEPAILVERLKSANTFTLAISGLNKSGDLYGPGSLDATFTVRGGANMDQIRDIIEQAGYQRPAQLVEDDQVTLLVTDGDSVFDATAPGGLQISKDEPLLWWVNKYEEYHGITAPIPMKTEVKWTRESLKVDDLTIRCHRTLRVPDGDESSELPPNMGAFPFFPVDQLGLKAPEDMKKRGGFIMPMFRREALWVSFRSGPDNPAVKVSVGGVNIVSGKPSADPSPLENGCQDYVVAGRQPWVDGIVTGEGVVRQFVVTEMHKGYTVEEQVTGGANIGGLQVDIYPRRPKPVGHFYRTDYQQNRLAIPDEAGRRLDRISATPAELQLEQEKITYERGSHNSSSTTPAATSPWTLSGYARCVSPNPRLKANYPAYPRVTSPSAPTGPGWFTNDGFYPDGVFSRPNGDLHANKHMSSRANSLSASTLMGIAAGGRIKQKMYRDKESVRVYNEQLVRRFHIHIVTPELWEDLTGVLPPITPVTREMYAMHGIPWYKLFDDYVESITEVSEGLLSVRSVSALDKSKFDSTVNAKDAVINPDAPPPCFQHPLSVSSCVFRPCGHAVCAKCIGPALLGGSKCSCGSQVAKFVGMKRALPQVNIAKESEDEPDEGVHHWSVQEIEKLSLHAVRRGKVVIIHRLEDSVAPLQQNPIPHHHPDRAGNHPWSQLQ